MKPKIAQSMTKQIDEAIADYTKSLRDLQKTKQAVAHFPPEFRELPVLDVYLQAWDFTKHELRLSLPWVNADIAKHRLMLESLGWKHKDSTEVLSEGRRYEDFRNKEYPFDLTLAYDASGDGASCVITKIGETKEVKEVVTPVYEVTCPDGANENAFAPA